MVNPGRTLDAPFTPGRLSGLARLVDEIADWTVLPGYSRLGFALRRPLWREPAPPTFGLRRRRILVTGASSGIGEALCEQLARAGASVLMGVRALERGASAKRRIAARTDAATAARVRPTRLDVADLEDVARFAAAFDGDALDGLVHNAGVLTERRERSPQGHELTFATAVLGPFALTRALAGALREDAPASVVFVSSGGMYTARLRAEDPELEASDFDGARFYAHAKRAQVVLASLFAERWKGSGVGFAAIHPGWVDTPGLAGALPAFRRAVGPILRDPAAGADSAAWLLGRDLTDRSGRFWHDRRVRAEHRVPWTREPPADRERLWSELLALAADPAPRAPTGSGRAR
jgi:dehydrogenase/reductase SDR family member 12